MLLIHELIMFHDAIATAEFQDQLCLPSALHWATFATVLCAPINGSLWWCSDLLLKRDELNHTGSHKINCIGQIYWQKRWAKLASSQKQGLVNMVSPRHRGYVIWIAMHRLHGRQRCGASPATNVFRMNLLGATVVPVKVVKTAH